MDAWRFGQADVADVVTRVGHFLTQHVQLVAHFEMSWHDPGDEIVARLGEFAVDIFGAGLNDVAVQRGEEF